MKSNMDKRRLKTQPKLNITLNDEQKEVRRLFYEFDVNFVHGDFGCLGKGTKVIMYDGSYKKVEDVIKGDLLLGPDSKPRKVLELKRGREQMYNIIQIKGNNYRVNENHILSLDKKTRAKYHRKTDNEGKRYYDYSQKPYKEKENSILNISIKEYLKLSNYSKSKLKGYISELITFEEKELLIEPYYLGLWLGDGSKNDIKSITNVDNTIKNYLESLSDGRWENITYIQDCNNTELRENFKSIYNISNSTKLSEKYIPKDYLINSKENRLKLLAGIIDSDGHYIVKGKSYEIIQKNKQLSEEITFLCRSLGFRTNIRPKIATMKREDGSVYECEVFRITFTPDQIIPVKIFKKKQHEERLINKDFRVHGIEVIKDIVDNYYGFTLDSDNLFLLEDFTVTHNSGKTLVSCAIALAAFRKKEFNNIIIARPSVKNSVGFLPGDIREKLEPLVAPILHNFNMCQSAIATEKMMEENQIQILPVDFAKGITYVNSVVIVDEYQDLDYEDFRMMLSRLGVNSKLIFCGSKEQIHRSINKHSCIYESMRLKNSDLVGYSTLLANHRNPAIMDVIKYLEGHKNEE